MSMHWILAIVSAYVAAATSTELVPERFLRPRDFNHHPFTDVGGPPVPKPIPIVSQPNPYAVLSQKKPREGREFARQDIIFYPSPHPSVLPAKKFLETNEIGGADDAYVNIPKNYAFSYIVRDHQSGDDFSHSQAHNGKATRGQYRVKLPDGRVQVVSYTADHKGYRADVQYEDDSGLGHVGKGFHKSTAILPSPTPKTIEKYHAQAPRFNFVASYTAEPSNHLTSPGGVPRKEHLTAPGPLKLVLAPVPKANDGPRYYNVLNDFTPSTRAPPFAVPSTPRHDERFQQLLSPTPTPFAHDPYSVSNNFDGLASPAPKHVFVTPRTLLNAAAAAAAAGRKGDHEGQHVIYKFV